MGIVLEGEYSNAEIFQEQSDIKLKQQIINLLNNPVSKDAEIKFMPDAHPGKYFPIGLYGEFNIKNGIMPSLVGNDIGCGITAVMIDIPKKKFSFEKLDRVISSNIPTGRDIHKHINDTYDNLFRDLVSNINDTLTWKSFRTLGSGNHFIEIDKDSNNNYWLIVHSGSRYLGNAILEYWLNWCRENNTPEVYELGIINNTDAIKKYINDCKIARKFANYNRDEIIKTICKKSGIEFFEDKLINTCHNCILEDILADSGKIIVRKGVSYSRTPIPISINPSEGHLLVQPINAELKYSLPHGAGRLIARKEVANSHTVNEYKKDMKSANIHCTTISKGNLDECPKAYRNREYLEKALDFYNLGNVVDEWKPVYVYKPKE